MQATNKVKPINAAEAATKQVETKAKLPRETETKCGLPKYKCGENGAFSPDFSSAENYEEYLVLYAQFKASLSTATGTEDPVLCEHLLNQVIVTLVGEKDIERAINASIAMMRGIAPKDELEGMLAAQMVAVHGMAMEMASRAMLNEQTPDGVTEGVNRVTKLMRTFTAQMEALQKYRTKGQQTIQVQHVQVNEGGQAIVGNVKTGGGG